MGINRRNFSLLSGDYERVKSFLHDNYVKYINTDIWAEERLEYDLSTSWFAYISLFRIAVWEKEEEIVAVAAYGMQLGEAYLMVKDGYDVLYPEMVQYAEENLSSVNNEGKMELQVQTCVPVLSQYLKEHGYVEAWCEDWKVYDFSKALPPVMVPEGYEIVTLDQVSKSEYKQVNDVTWQGFHDGEGEGILEGFLCNIQAPNFNNSLAYVAKTTEGEYCGYGSVWLNKSLNYGYLEPLSIHPKYQKKGLAKAIIYRAINDIAKLGAEFITGGPNEFYDRIGYRTVCKKQYYKKTLHI